MPALRRLAALAPRIAVIRDQPRPPRELCPAVIGDVLVYRNSGHLTATYARSLTPWLSRRLPVLPG